MAYVIPHDYIWVRPGVYNEAVVFPFYVFLRRLAAAEWHGRFGPAFVAETALRLSIEHPLTPSEAEAGG